MNLAKYKKIKFFDIATAERAVKGKIYPAGSIMIQLSASDGQVYYKEKAGEIESKYAVICLNDDTYEPEYIYICLQRSLPEFVARYKTDINIQFDTLKYITLDVHEEREARQYVVKMMKQLDDAIYEESKIIDYYKDMKKVQISRMMV